MAAPSACAPAPVIPLPTAARSPVVNPRRRGRYPRAVVPMYRARIAREVREWEEQQRQDEIERITAQVEHLRDFLAADQADLAIVTAKLAALRGRAATISSRPDACRATRGTEQ